MAPELRYEIYTRKYHDECVALLSDAFTQRSEPVGNHIPYESGAIQYFFDYYLKQADQQNMSTVCIDEGTGKAVGVAVSYDFNEDPPDDSFLEILTTKWDPLWFPQVFAIMEALEETARKTLPDGKGIGWYIFLIGVSAEYCNLGIGSRLVAENIQLAKERGFAFALADCTNDYSTKCFQKHGFEVQK